MRTAIKTAAFIQFAVAGRWCERFSPFTAIRCVMERAPMLLYRSRLIGTVMFMLLFAGSTFAQGIPHNISPVTGPNGQPRPGATVSFCQHPANAVPCTNYQNAYSDIALTQLINQTATPFKTDGLGNVPAFYAAPGIYDYTVSGTGIAAPNGPYVINLPPATNGSNNWTGPNSFSQPITSTVTGMGVPTLDSVRNRRDGRKQCQESA